MRRLDNGGPAAARNSGLDEARGRYVSFLDDDDIYEPDRLAIALEGFERSRVTICGDRSVDGSPGDTCRLDGDVRDDILNTTTPHLGRTSVCREVVPRFDERFRTSEDTEWWLRLASLSPVTTVSRVGFRYRRHDGLHHGTGVAERVCGNLMLLAVHEAYFASHRRAAAFRWKRVGIAASEAGDQALARAALTRSLGRSPNVRTAWRLAQCLRYSTATIDRRPVIAGTSG